MVLYDANVLYPAPVRDLLIRVAMAGLVSARWTARIHQEWMQSLMKNRPDLSAAQLERTLQLMEQALPGAQVDGFEHRIPRLALPDPKDRHVLAAAIETGAHVILTFNTRDFPSDVLQAHRIQAYNPDAFLLTRLVRSPDALLSVVRAQRVALRSPPRSVLPFLDELGASGLPRLAAELRERRTEL